MARPNTAVNGALRRIIMPPTYQPATSLLIAAAVTQKWWLAGAALVQGYAFAWVGHFFFEHNKPATFRYPGFSLMGDWRLWWDILTGRQKF